MKQKRASSLHRTATTFYPCCGQALGEFERSWSCRTYPVAKVRFFIIFPNISVFFPQHTAHDKKNLLVWQNFKSTSFLWSSLRDFFVRCLFLPKGCPSGTKSISQYHTKVLRQRGGIVLRVMDIISEK